MDTDMSTLRRDGSIRTSNEAQAPDTLARLLALADEVVHRTRKGGADVVEVVARSGSELSVRVRLGEPEHVEEAGHHALGMRVMKRSSTDSPFRVALVSTSDTTDAGIARFVEDALEMVDLAQEDPWAGPPDAALLARGPWPDLQLYDASCGSITAEEAARRARLAEQAARDFDARITNSDGATFSRTEGASVLVTSGGFRGGSRGSYASLVMTPLADEAGTEKKRRGYYWTAKRKLALLENEIAVGEEAARRTLRKLGAKKVASTEAPVIFDPDAGRSILGLFASCIAGGAIYRKSSYLVGREGSSVAACDVCIDDDPLILGAPGSRPFDGEGLPSRVNHIVSNGVLQTYLLDGYSARKLQRASKGNASRGGSGGVGVSTSNFVLRPTSTKAKDIIQSTKSGFYVTEMMGFGFNAVTGDFSRGASGFWIENGELTYPVSEVTISLNLSELLQRIDAIGDDLDLRTSTATPTFRVAKMVIAGA